MACENYVRASGLASTKGCGRVTPVDVAHYIEETAVKLHPAQRALIEVTIAHPRGKMMGDTNQLAWFSWMLRQMGARRVVDVGVFTGCSALAAALAVSSTDGAKVFGLDISEEYVNIGKPFFEQAGVKDIIDIRIGSAINSLDQLLTELGSDSIDFIFIDAVKLEYLEYYERSLKLIRRGGIIAFDNMLMSGRVVNPAADDENARFCRVVTETLRDDKRIDFSLLPIGDGVALARKL